HHRERREAVRRGYVQHPGVRRRPGRVAAARLVPAVGGGARRPGTAAVDGRSPSMIAHRVSETSALRERLARSLDERREPGAAAAQREGRWVWHVYEDLRSETLADRCERPRLEAAVDLIAQLHTRGAGHPLLPEVRWLARDHGGRSLITNLRDGIGALEALATVCKTVFAQVRRHLL